MEGIFLVDGKLAYGIIDKSWEDIKVKLEDGEEVIDEDGDPIYEFPPVFYRIHILTEEQWQFQSEKSRAFWSWRRRTTNVTDPEARAFYEKYMDQPYRDYAGQPEVGIIHYEDIASWTRVLLAEEIPDWFDQNYEQYDPRNE